MKRQEDEGLSIIHSTHRGDEARNAGKKAPFAMQGTTIRVAATASLVAKQKNFPHSTKNLTKISASVLTWIVL
ncbi:MAG: hypothetical protein WBM24_21990 [Candidatus Sulfotelmatobacter sp.]